MILTLEQMQYLSIDQITNLYRIGYRLEENPHITISLTDPTVDPVVNFGKVTVSALHNNTDTSIGINDSSRLPNPSTSGDFNVIWWNADDYPDPSDDPNREIVRCTANSSNTLTVTRAQEGTSASNKNTSGKTYKMVLSMTAKTISDLQTDAQNKVNTHQSLTSSVHNFDSSGNAPAQSHGSSRHTGTIGTWSQIDKTTSDLADITTKSHTSLSNIGTNTHAQIDTHIGTNVTGIHGISGTPSSGQVLTATSSTAANWQTPATVPSPASTVVSETSFGQSSAVGSSTLYSRADHTHGTPSSSGFMTTGNAASSVVSETSFGQSSAVGTSTNYARQDHTHGTPSGVYVGQSTSGQYASTRYGGSTSVNWNNGNVQSISLANGSNSISLSNGINGGRYMLLLTSGGGSSSVSSWSGGSGVKWPGGTLPTFNTTGKVDIVTFVFDGTYYYGNVSFNY